jgi:hypothetical protein
MLPIISLCALFGNAALASQSIELRVTATIPPQPCQFPETCEQAPSNAPSKLIVSDGSIYYVGSAPSVRTSGDLVSVIF